AQPRRHSSPAALRCRRSWRPRLRRAPVSRAAPACRQACNTPPDARVPSAPRPPAQSHIPRRAPRPTDSPQATQLLPRRSDRTCGGEHLVSRGELVAACVDRVARPTSGERQQTGCRADADGCACAHFVADGPVDAGPVGDPGPRVDRVVAGPESALTKQPTVRRTSGSSNPPSLFQIPLRTCTLRIAVVITAA